MSAEKKPEPLPYIYFEPEKYGFEAIGQIEWEGRSYEFDLTVVVRETATGKLFYAADSGCSCPTPFEFQTRESLTEITSSQVFLDHIKERLKDAPKERAGEAGELAIKVRQALRGERKPKSGKKKDKGAKRSKGGGG